MKKNLKRFVALLLSLCMIFSLGVTAFADESAEDTSAAATEATGTLKAGAGGSPIIFDEAMFPIEGFSGEVESDPYLRIMIIEDVETVAIVSAEMVNTNTSHM